jgi:hypothetical protein
MCRSPLAGFAQCAVEGRLESPLGEDDDDPAPDPVPLVPPCATVPPGLAGTAGKLLNGSSLASVAGLFLGIYFLHRALGILFVS